MAAEGRAEGRDDTRVGGALLAVAGLLLLGGSIWHLSAFRGPATTDGLARAIVAAPSWAPGHFVLALGFALLAAALPSLGGARSRLGSSPAPLSALGLLAVGSLAMVAADLIDGFVGATLAANVLDGRDVAAFTALFEVDRGFEAIGFGLFGSGGALLAAAQLRRPTLAPRWATWAGLAGMAGLACAGLLGRGLLIGPLAIGLAGAIPAFAWIILLGVLALKTPPPRRDRP